MNVSHGSVHPVEDVPTTKGAGPNPLRVRMKDLPGMPGTPGGLVLRLTQFFFPAAALVVMATTSDFPTVTAFWFLAQTGLVSVEHQIREMGLAPNDQKESREGVVKNEEKSL